MRYGFHLGWVVACVLLAWTSSASADPVDALQAAAPRCPEAASVCVPMEIYVVVTDAGPVQTPAWIAAQLAEANRHFAPLGVGFVPVIAAAPSEVPRIVEGRSDRDRLGRKRYRRGVISVFVVERLDNVDEPGEIRGVHWRDRRARSTRWVIMSSIAPSIVLAHELGHFFGLPHSIWPNSIMNKRDGRREAFAEPEIDRMRRRLRRMLKSGELKLARRLKAAH